MKKFNILLLISLLLFAFTACDNDEDLKYITPTDQVEKPILKNDGLTYIVVDEENYNYVPAVLSWTASDFGQEVLTKYTLEISKNEDFSNSYEIVLGNNVYTKSLTNQELSELAISKFGGLDEDGNPLKVDLLLRVSASIFLENPTVTIPPDVLYSNVIDISVVPYVKPDEFPTEMYMIGKDFGDWSWDSNDVVTMTPVNSFPGHFWAVRYITAGNGFKWCEKKAWSGDFYSLGGGDKGFYNEDGNAFVAEDGMYMIYVDMENKQIVVEPAQVYGMGDCFGGWNTGAYPFDVEGKTMTLTTTAAGELRIYANCSIAPVGNDWWKMEFVPIDGVIQYRGEGGDQTRVPVEAGKKVVLDFNAGTGSFN